MSRTSREVFHPLLPALRSNGPSGIKNQPTRVKSLNYSDGAVVAPHGDAAAASRAAGDAARDLGRHGGGGRPSAPAPAAAGRLLLEELELAPLVHAGPARGGRIGRRRGGS